MSDKPKRESKQMKALRAVQAAATLARDELKRDTDLVDLRLQYIQNKIRQTWPNL